MATLLRSPFFWPRNRSLRLGRAAGPFQSGGVTDGSEHGRAGPGGGGRGRAALGGAAAARSPWAAALRPQSFPGADPCARCIGLQPFRLREAPRTREKRESKGWGLGFQSKKADECSKLEIGFGRRFSGGYFRRRSRQTFRVSQGARFPDRRARREQAAGGNPAAVPRRPGGPARRTGMDTQMDGSWMSAASEQVRPAYPLPSLKNWVFAVCAG